MIVELDDEDSGNNEGSGNDEDSGNADSEDSGDESDIELVDGMIKTATSATQKELPKVAAQNLKKRKLQVIEKESSDEETGESICCGIRFVCWILKLIGRNLRHDI